MSVLVKQAINEIRNAIIEAAGRAVADGEFPEVALSDFIIEVPANKENGDYSSNAAMAWARDLKSAPRKIAQTIVDRLELCDTFVDRCEIAGPGFMNFYLKESYNACIVQDILEKGDSYGRSDYGAGKKINIEFVSANPTGPMHMGNARGGALGDCLAAVMDFAGYDVSREFYVNDAGNQIDKFALSRLAQLIKNVDAAFETYEFYKYFQHLQNFAFNFLLLLSCMLCNFRGKLRYKSNYKRQQGHHYIDSLKSESVIYYGNKHQQQGKEQQCDDL